MVLDGRGSARLSHVGTAAAHSALRDSIRKWEPELKRILDSPGHDQARVGWQGFAQMLYHVAAREQTKLAGWYETRADEFEFTLTLGIIGMERIGWLAVGDSPLVVSRHGVLGLAMPLETVGFANQTSFVEACPKGRLGLTGGLIPTSGVSALLAMSDGSAARLLHLRQQTPAPAVKELMDLLSFLEPQEDRFRAMLADPSWDRVTRDDRCIALLVLRPEVRKERRISRDVPEAANLV